MKKQKNFIKYDLLIFHQEILKDLADSRVPFSWCPVISTKVGGVLDYLDNKIQF